jgi:hypothetical protein
MIEKAQNLFAPTTRPSLCAQVFAKMHEANISTSGAAGPIQDAPTPFGDVL